MRGADKGDAPAHKLVRFFFFFECIQDRILTAKVVYHGHTLWQLDAMIDAF